MSRDLWDSGCFVKALSATRKNTREATQTLNTLVRIAYFLLTKRTAVFTGAQAISDYEELQAVPHHSMAPAA